LLDEAIPVEWIRFGVRSGVQFEREEDGIGLPQIEQETLLESVDRFDASHVLFSELPSITLAQFLSRGAPHIVSEYFDTERPAGRFYMKSTLMTWLGFDDANAVGKPCTDASVLDATPNFFWKPANELAELKPPIAHILAGPECLHNKSIEHNPYYRSVDFDQVTTKNRCAFCIDSSADGQFKLTTFCMAPISSEKSIV
jgi:hypothetical protein